ncbi:MAG: DUF1833 family protein [Rhodoferax sp.]|nr:DUF1833 family protein [Rhodoferax sp.]
MTDTTLSQALKEAYASAPSGVVIYHTLELYHPAFSSPVRVVRDYADLTATLEATAPRNPSEAVTFVAFSFDFTKPEVSPTGIPQITLTMDNVDRAIVANIEAAMSSTDAVTVIYREYLSTDLTAPANNPPLEMTLLSVIADVFKVTATAGFPNLMNKRFPTTEYNSEVFNGLVT